jgi:hypothetical protein
MMAVVWYSVPAGATIISETNGTWISTVGTTTSSTNTITTSSTTNAITTGSTIVWYPIQLPTEEELVTRDQEAYQKALREHDDQEAVRLRQQIVDRELVIASRQQIEEEQRIRREEERTQRVNASDRARTFLLSHLTPQQKETFEKNNWFVVEGGRTKTKYRINCNTASINIEVLNENNKKIHRLCAHPNRVPLGDQLLAQKLMLENAEDDFLRVANRHA